MSASALALACSDPRGNDPNVPDLAGAVSIDAASTTTSACPSALPPDCPVTPSYMTDIAPILARSCLECHVSGGVAADRLLDTVKRVQKLDTTMFLQINGCLMPPADAGADAMLSLDDRKEILQWLVCGAPSN